MTKSVAALRVRKQPSDRLKTHPDKELQMVTSFGWNICFVQIDDMCPLKPHDFNSCLVKNYTNHNSENPPIRVDVSTTMETIRPLWESFTNGISPATVLNYLGTVFEYPQMVPLSC